MNGTEKKKIVDGKEALPLGTKLSEEIAEFKINLEFLAGECVTPVLIEDFEKILNDMFLLMHHHRYGVLYNILKKFR